MGCPSPQAPGTLGSLREDLSELPASHPSPSPPSLRYPLPILLPPYPLNKPFIPSSLLTCCSPSLLQPQSTALCHVPLSYACSTFTACPTLYQLPAQVTCLLTSVNEPIHLNSLSFVQIHVGLAHTGWHQVAWLTGRWV